MSTNNTTSVPAAEPTLVITNERTLNRMMAERAILLQRAAKASADMKALRPRLEAARAEAVQAVAAHDTLQKQYDQLMAEVLGNESEAKDLQALVSAGAKAMNWPVPDEVDDPAMQETGSFEAVQPPVLDPDCRDRKHGSCMGDPCECFCHVYAYLLGQHIGVVLADGSAEIWGDLEGVDGHGLAVRDGRGITNTFQRSAIGHVLLDDGQKAAPYGKPADLDTPTTTPAQDGGQG